MQVLTVERVGLCVAARRWRVYPSRCKSVTKSQLPKLAQVDRMDQSFLPERIAARTQGGINEMAYQKWAWSRLVFWTIGNRIDRREGDDLFRRIESYSHVSMVSALETLRMVNRASGENETRI